VLTVVLVTIGTGGLWFIPYRHQKVTNCEGNPRMPTHERTTERVLRPKAMRLLLHGGIALSALDIAGYFGICLCITLLDLRSLGLCTTTA
jgi:hypothetical protein